MPPSPKKKPKAPAELRKKNASKQQPRTKPPKKPKGGGYLV
jgi:hypothetical protein